MQAFTACEKVQSFQCTGNLMCGLLFLHDTVNLQVHCNNTGHKIAIHQQI